LALVEIELPVPNWTLDVLDIFESSCGNGDLLGNSAHASPRCKILNFDIHQPFNTFHHLWLASNHNCKLN
jgi:hypothetical protein